ncbi:MAG: 4Fe-4S binding protein [Planctomycetota bacterium]|nr:4Fe-4S binding protein [Planctomycetota bacterium]
MYEGEDLCDKCMQCVKNCPTDAFRKEVSRINEIEIGGKVFRFPETNKWRCAWAENFCLNLNHEIPEKVDEATILRFLEKFGMRGGEEGCCLQFCMNPQRRYYDRSYCRPPRRKKHHLENNAEKLLSAIKDILDAAGADVVAIGPTEKFDIEQQVNPEFHLPDAASLICIGVRIPLECTDNSDYLTIVERRLNYAAFDAAHHLDITGYSAVSNTNICSELLAERLGIYEMDVRYTTVLTSAPLPSIKCERSKAKMSSNLEQLREFCRKSGADLVGFFTVERFARFCDALETTGIQLKQAEVVEDKGLIYGPYVPRIEAEDASIKSPADWLEGAKSVIVLALHFPDAVLDTAKVTPAETVGPFAFARYEAQRLLGDAAFRIIQRLNDSGYRAAPTYDLSGLSSKVHSSRGMLPDMRANRFAVLLGGLAFIGVHGCPITAEFGVRQVFFAIVTDCPLPDDPLYEGQIDCRDCDKLCVDACPTSAISTERVGLKLEKKTFELGRIDFFACDWATRYCLTAEAGPRYCGLDVDAPVPDSKNVLAVAKAVSKVNWGVQKRHSNIAEE